MSRKVFLWAPPRSLSTAFTRAMLNVENCEVFLEPYWHGHYSLWGDTYGLTSNLPPEKIHFSFDKTNDLILEKSAAKQFVFCKEVAKDVGLPLNFLLDEKLSGFQHTFLIRHPKKTIPSLYRMYDKSNFYPDAETIDFSIEAGFFQLYNTFEFVCKNLDSSPVVIFADDLLEDPEKVLEYNCGQTGLPYRKGMSSWKPGPIDGWDPAELYTNAMESSGIGKLGKSRNRVPMVENTEIKRAIEDNVFYFEKMYEHRVQF